MSSFCALVSVASCRSRYRMISVRRRPTLLVACRSLVLLCLVCAPLACSNNPAVDSPGDPEKHSLGRDGGPEQPDDTLLGADASAASCRALTCEQARAECGLIGDGCGGVVDCGACGAGQFCGVLKPSRCASASELCAPLTPDEACVDKSCGAAGDGCGGTIDCGSCADDEVCGLVTPFECAPAPEFSAQSCPAELGNCEEQGVECGFAGNGCGEVIDCNQEVGGCLADEVCGAETVGRCGLPPDCLPLSAAEACDGRCGFVSNGCGVEVDGGLIDCSALGFGCADDEICGGAGVANECATTAEVCSPITAQQACEDKQCGAVSDGCSGSVGCGTCAAGTTCREGSCELDCSPLSATDACADKGCGVTTDGCGGTIDCGSCPSGETCGATEAYQCGVRIDGCQPMTPAEACADKECGVTSDGCGTDAASLIDCDALTGGCGAGEACGVGAAYQCDDPMAGCVQASSCRELGWECGLAVDECGNVFDCAAEGIGCNPEQETCIGGINGPARCLAAYETDSQGECPLCDAIPNCFGQQQVTTLAGRVQTPGRHAQDVVNQVGIPNAFVYILQVDDLSALPSVDAGIPDVGGQPATACERCEDQDLGPVLVSTTTDALGQFVLRGSIPVEEEFILVVKTGKWRRAQRITLPSSAACAATSLPLEQTRLPRSMNDGLGANIPRVAVSTGRVDAMECVFSKLGVSDGEFALPGAGGADVARIHMYRADVQGGAQMAGGTASDAELHANLDRLFSYDMVVFDCQSTAVEHPASDPNIREFVNRGGRLFASHWSYTWIYDNGNLAYDAMTPLSTGLSSAATWISGLGTQSVDVGYISLQRPGANLDKAGAFAQWAVNEQAATIDAQGRYAFEITDPRDLASSVGDHSEEFVYRLLDDLSGASDFCRPCSALSDEMCSVNPNCEWRDNACTFVNDCNTKTESACVLDPQCQWSGSCSFKTDCDSGDVDKNQIDTCLARDQCGWAGSTVQQFSFNTPYGAPEENICGRVAYSGFHVVSEAGKDYAAAIFPEHCSGPLSEQEKVLLYMLFDLGACVSNEQAAPPECTPLTSAACSGRCGAIADGCGGYITCGGCGGGLVCTPGGICAEPECKPATCTSLGAECGTISDGCGELLSCGSCALGSECGIAEPNRCSASCEPLLAGDVCGADVCGYVSNGCDDVIPCGDCQAGFACRQGECVEQSCVPLTECPVAAECGRISDGCSGELDCGDTCTLPEICGGAGVPNVCGEPACVPLTCEEQNAECGLVGDGCGGSRNCGACADNTVCGLHEPNRCGGCVPRTCGDADAQCGIIGDGCGGQLDCGGCPEGLLCGALGPNRCAEGPACEPLGCGAQGIECGLAGDGCGETIDCGACPDGEVCGGQMPFRCGSPAACVPRTCDDVEAECGAIGDGCGDIVECGECPVAGTCGRTAPNRCPMRSAVPQ